jgi:hypothetical protein
MRVLVCFLMLDDLPFLFPFFQKMNDFYYVVSTWLFLNDLKKNYSSFVLHFGEIFVVNYEEIPLNIDRS